MKIKDFKLERYFAKHEFTAKYLLSSSDCDGYEQSHILSRANSEELKMWEDIKLGYTESAGNPILRESISIFITPIILITSWLDHPVSSTLFPCKSFLKKKIMLLQ